jgi:VWFA-related protein
VFDPLSPGARDFARRAALVYASDVHRPGDVVGVFTIGRTLSSMGPFTTDVAQIREGVERATIEGLTAPPASEARSEVRRRIQEVNGTEDYLRTATQGPPSSSRNLGILSSQIAGALRAIQIERASEGLERDQQGYATTAALMALARGLGTVRGRKTLVLFSEGLVIPSSVYSSFRAVIDAANRANVSFYTVDAAGLRAQSPLHEVRQELTRSVERRERELTGGASDVHPLRQLERNEDMLRLTPASTLGPLARETGGVFVSDANDVKEWLLGMAEDMRFHYILSYTPRNSTYDGRFRKVSVEVRRRGVEVRTRHGYFATPPPAPRALPDTTAKALAALEVTPPPDDFPLYASALSFPADEPEGLVPVFLEVPCDQLEFAPGEDGELRGDVALVARIRDEEGRTFARVGQRFRPHAPSPMQPGSEAGGLLFHPLVRLPAGRFLLEAAAHDAVAEKTSVRVRAFLVSGREAGAVRLSSLVVAKGIRKLDSPPVAEADPLVFGESLLQPNLGETVRKSETPSLAFFFVAQGRDRAPEEATVEVWGDGARVCQRALKLEPPDAQGNVRQAGSVSLGPLSPGLYTLKVVVASGDGSARTETSFSLAE